MMSGYTPLPEDSSPIVGVGSCNNATFYVLTLKDRLGKDEENNRVCIDITEHSFVSGVHINPWALATFCLEGNTGHGDLFVDPVALSPVKLLFAVTIITGKYDEEVFYFHGYLIQCSALKTIATRVFRLLFEAAPSIAVRGDDIYVVTGGEVTQMNAETFEIERTLKWPDQSLKYPSFGIWQNALFALMQTNQADAPVNKILFYNLATGDSKWLPIAPDSNYGHLRVAWHKSHGVFVQSANCIFAYCEGFVWRLDLDAKNLRWEQLSNNKCVHERPDPNDFLFADSSGGLYIAAQAYEPKRLIRVDVDFC